MLNFCSYRELRNGKRCNSNRESEMSENGDVEENRSSTSSEKVEEEIPEIHTFTQEAVKEQIKGFISPLTRQVEEMIKLVQGMVTTLYLSPYSRADYITTSGTVTYLFDIRNKIVG